MAEHSICHPGRPGPQGLSHFGSPGLAAFHKAKSLGLRLRSLTSMRAPCLQLLRIAIAQFAIIRIAGDIEINVAAGRVGVALVDQPLNNLKDVADVLRGARHVIDAVDIEPFEIAAIVGRDALGEFGDGGFLLGSLDDQLVVHVGDVDDERDLIVEVRQIALDGVEDDGADHVADVAGFVDGRPTYVHAHLARLDRLKLLFLAGQRVIDAQGHSDSFMAFV